MFLGNPLSTTDMRFFGSYFALIFFIAVLACNPSSKKEDSAKTDGLIQGKISSEVFGNCDTVSNHGVSVHINMWLPSDSGGVAEKIKLQLQEKVVDRINSYADSASIASNPGAKKSAKDAYEVFLKNYTDFKKEFPDAPGCWEVELKGDTVMITPKMVLYELDHYAFTGGAHPNSFKSLHVFDAKTGEEKEIKTFVSDTAALLVKTEAAFRKVEKLAPDVHLEEEGYFLKNNQFFLPANYIFTRNGILFYYNPYEIAPYVKGAIEFTIPYGELEGIVKKDLIF